jgi:hypothetical protein
MRWPLFAVAAIIGCGSVVADQTEQAFLLILDNYGGHAHAGRRVLVITQEHCAETRYTDDSRDLQSRLLRCRYEPETGTLELSGAEASGEKLFRTTFGGAEYWVKASDVERVKRPEEELLRQTSLRNKR